LHPTNANTNAKANANTAHLGIKLLATSALGLAAVLAGCAKPPVIAAAPPPPVGHTYQTLVAVPPAPKYVHIKPEDQEKLQQAFNVIGLKSALMVGALSCEQQDQYDKFMTAFQPHILEDQHMMDAYFRRIGGRYGQTKEDDFVTLLANNQSVGGIGQGKVFCLNNQAEFNQVMTLKTPDQLDSFVTDQSPDPVVTPIVSTTPKPVVHHVYTKKTIAKPASTVKTTAPHS
jgi:hypothetical protein